MAASKNERTYRPEEIAESLGISGKVVRAYLRANYTRPAEAKGSTWIVPANVRNEVVKHFTERNTAQAK